MSTARTNFFASCPKGASPFLLRELESLGDLHDLNAESHGVSFSGERLDGARVCLHSRLASRVIVQLSEFSAPNADALYEHARELSWETYMSSLGTFAVQATGTNAALRHTGFVALKVKDAIVDRLRAKVGRRPDVAREDPDVQVVVHITEGKASIGLDVGGGPLHRRGWRQTGMEAPLKENLAALILAASGYDGRTALLDPMCGSGTILIEAAEMALGLAPGRRLTFGCERWPILTRPERKTIQDWRREACQRPTGRAPRLEGSDLSVEALAGARQNVRKAGLADYIRLSRADARQASFLSDGAWIITNPPYGERMDNADDLPALYTALGHAWRDAGNGQIAVFCGHPGFRRAFALQTKSVLEFHNGPIETKLLVYDIGRAHTARKHDDE